MHRYGDGVGLMGKKVALTLHEVICQSAHQDEGVSKIKVTLTTDEARRLAYALRRYGDGGNEQAKPKTQAELARELSEASLGRHASDSDNAATYTQTRVSRLINQLEAEPEKPIDGEFLFDALEVTRRDLRGKSWVLGGIEPSEWPQIDELLKEGDAGNAKRDAERSSAVALAIMYRALSQDRRFALASVARDLLAAEMAESPWCGKALAYGVFEYQEINAATDRGDLPSGINLPSGIPEPQGNGVAGIKDAVISTLMKPFPPRATRS
jgi:hypothetical protein